MANATSSCFGTIFRFTVDVSNLASNPIESSEIQVNNVNWKIKLRKNTVDDGGTEALGIYLVSPFNHNTANSTCEAQAAFKLLRNDDQSDQSVVKYLRKQTFSNINRSHGFDDFIDWNDFHAHFVNEGKAILKVEISAEPIYRATEMNIEQEYAKIHVLLEKANELQSCYSPVTVVRGIKWKLLIEKRDDALAIFLQADKMDMCKNWFYDVECTFELLSIEEENDGMKRMTRTDYHYDKDDWGFAHFIQWEDFTTRYTYADQANFVVEFKVHEPRPLWKLNSFNLSKANSLLQCAVCLECFSTGEISTIKCGHLFCEPCFIKSTRDQQLCPVCKVPTSANDLHPIFFS